MPRPELTMSPAEVAAFLAAQPTVHLASTLADGTPALRTVYHVVDDGWLRFPIADETAGLVGRPAVIQAEEPIATVPDAVAAASLHRRVEVRGGVEEVAAPGTAGVRLERATGTQALGQDRGPEQVAHLLERLWRRGLTGDARAIELIRAANPAAPTPAFLAGPAGTTLHGWLPPTAATDAADLLVDTYWNDVFTHADLVRAHVGAAAWIGARDRDGRLIGSARALSDDGKLAWLYDVVVAPAWRGRGVGQALVRLILDHPAVRRARRVWLGTRDAQTLYAKFGFIERQDLPPRGFTTTDMVLCR